MEEKRLATGAEKTVISATELASIKTYVEDCLKKVSEDALFDRIGRYGGYISLSGEYGGLEAPPTIIYLGKDYPILYDYNDGNRKFYNLSVGDVKKEISKYVAVEFENCLNLSIFENVYNITKPVLSYKDINISINIGDIDIEINYSVILQKKDSEGKLVNFKTNLPIRLGLIYNNITMNLLKNISNYNYPEQYNFSDCDEIIPNGCTNNPSTISKIIFIETIDDVAGVIIIEDNRTRQYAKSFDFQFGLFNVNITGGCECDIVPEVPIYTLTIEVSPLGSGTTTPESPGEHIYNEGEVVYLTAVPSSGYVFNYWTGDVENPNSAITTITMNDNKTVQAHFVEDISRVSYWAFNGNANDSWGTNDGIIYGNPEFFSGKCDQGLNFDGVGDYVTISDSSSLDITDEITVEAWINDPPGDWADSNFDKCMDITIENVGATTLTNFPAYIKLPYDSDMQSDYSDIRFYSEACNNGGIALDYEIESYTASEAHVWVRIPSLPSEGTTISVYYKKNQEIGSGENPNGVWDDNYKGVWHLGEEYALDFDGLDDYVDLSSSGLSIDNTDFTLMAWIKAKDNTNGPHRGIITFDYGSGTRLEYYIEKANAKQRLYYTGENYVDSGTGNLDDEAWHFITVIREGDDVKFYLDGQPDGTQPNFLAGINDFNTLHFIGHRNSNRYFNGSIDEVRIYSRALSPIEISDIYYGKPVPRTGLIGEWLMNKGSGSIATDSAGNNDGTIYGAIWVRPRAVDSTQNSNIGVRYGSMGAAVTGKIDRADDFDGGDDEISTSLSLDNSKPWSYVFWIKVTNSVDGNDEIMNGGNHNPRIWFTTDDISIAYKNNTGNYKTIMDGPTMSFGSWYHIAVTWDETEMRLYQNGVKVDNEIIPDGIYNHANNVGIGYRWGNPFNGIIDEVRVSNIERSEDWIKQSYQLVVNQDTFINFGSEQSAPEAVEEKIIIGKGTNAYEIQIDNNLNVTGYINNQVVSYEITKAWHHIALTYNGSEQRLYVDEDLKDSKPLTGLINVNSNSLTIGNNVNGIIDEVRIYNRALNQEEVTAGMSCS